MRRGVHMGDACGDVKRIVVSHMPILLKKRPLRHRRKSISNIACSITPHATLPIYFVDAGVIEHDAAVFHKCESHAVRSVYPKTLLLVLVLVHQRSGFNASNTELVEIRIVRNNGYIAALDARMGGNQAIDKFYFVIFVEIDC